MVEEGEMFGLLGPNGAGKSTTFNIMTAAIPKTAGSIKLQGTEINKGIMEVF
jgi:ATP-binding cassette subfamily A (ABC1) protein 3